MRYCLTDLTEPFFIEELIDNYSIAWKEDRDAVISEVLNLNKHFHITYVDEDRGTYDLASQTWKAEVHQQKDTSGSDSENDEDDENDQEYVDYSILSR